MRRLLTHSISTRNPPFTKQVQAVQQLLDACQVSPADINAVFPQVLSYPTDVLRLAFEKTIIGKLRPVFASNPRNLAFDAEYVGVKFGMLHSEEVNLKEISHAAFIEVLHKAEKPKLLWSGALSRLDTMKRGECVHLLHYFPDKLVEDKVIELSEGLQNSEEFCSLSKSPSEAIRPLIDPLYQQLLRDHQRVDNNYLIRALTHLKADSQAAIRENIQQRALSAVEDLCPHTLRLLTDAIEEPDNGVKATIARAVEMSDLHWFVPEDLLALAERLELLGVTLSEQCRKTLIARLIRFLSSPLIFHSNRAAALLQSLQKDSVDDAELTFLPNPPKEDTSPLVNLLREASFADLSKLLATAKSTDLVKIVQLVQYRVVLKEGLLDGIQNRLHALINPELSKQEVMDCCEILGRLYTLNRVSNATVEKLARVVQANPSWVTAETVVALAHQFSYATFNHAINRTICELIKSEHAREETSTTAPKVRYYYKKGKMYHMPQNAVLNGIIPSQVAILIISLQRGRMLDPKAHEIIHQYIKCLLPSFSMLSVKHRSSLLLCASYRENFSVGLWNELVKAVTAHEDCKFDTHTTLRSLAVYHTAATNVRNLLRNIPLACEQPLELVLNGKRLQDYSASKNPRIAKFS